MVTVGSVARVQLPLVVMAVAIAANSTPQIIEQAVTDGHTEFLAAARVGLSIVRFQRTLRGLFSADLICGRAVLRFVSSL